MRRNKRSHDRETLKASAKQRLQTGVMSKLQKVANSCYHVFTKVRQTSS